MAYIEKKKMMNGRTLLQLPFGIMSVEKAGLSH